MTRGCREPAACRTWAGFTLIEVLVVLTIIALLFVAVPRFTAGLAALRFEAAARAITTMLRDARSAAVASGREVDVLVDAKARRWQSSQDNHPHAFPQAIKALTVRFPGPLDRPPMLRFLPDGSATAAELTLQGERGQAQIVIEGIIGKVRLSV